MSSDHFIKMQIIEELKEAVRIKEKTAQLLETNINFTRWLLRFCEEHRIPPPDPIKLQTQIRESIALIEEISSGINHHTKINTLKEHTKDKQCLILYINV